MQILIVPNPLLPREYYRNGQVPRPRWPIAFQKVAGVEASILVGKMGEHVSICGRYLSVSAGISLGVKVSSVTSALLTLKSSWRGGFASNSNYSQMALNIFVRSAVNG